MKKILFVQLLNNYTGAPKVLYNELSALLNSKKYDISLLTSKTDGILSNIADIHIYDNGYRWSNNRFILAFFFLFAQVRIFFFVLFHKFDILYINTVLPFGAALAAKIKNKKIIYHVHEIYIKPGVIKRFYYKVMKKCAHRIICVSYYVYKNLLCEHINSVVIYNPIETHTIEEDIDAYLRKKFNNKIIFMPTSLKEYKGVFQFVEIAKLLPEYKFKLLCSVSSDELEKFFSEVELPNNIILIGKQKDLWPFYYEACVLMNLSLQDKFIETFGLTIAEGFDAFVPAVGPNYGGPKEIIFDGKNGFLVNPYNVSDSVDLIKQIMKDFDTYKLFALCAKESLSKFSPEVFIQKIEIELDNL